MPGTPSARNAPRQPKCSATRPATEIPATRPAGAEARTPSAPSVAWPAETCPRVATSMAGAARSPMPTPIARASDASSSARGRTASSSPTRLRARSRRCCGGGPVGQRRNHADGHVDQPQHVRSGCHRESLSASSTDRLDQRRDREPVRDIERIHERRTPSVPAVPRELAGRDAPATSTLRRSTGSWPAADAVSCELRAALSERRAQDRPVTARLVVAVAAHREVRRLRQLGEQLDRARVVEAVCLPGTCR